MVRVAGRPLVFVAVARYRKVVIEYRTRAAEHLFHPVVGRHVAVEVHVFPGAVVGRVVALRVAFEYRIFVLRAHEVIGVLRNQRILVGHVFHTAVDVVVDRYAARFAALGRDDDYTVGTARTVNGRRESVFQHVDGLDVRCRDVRDALHRESVDNVEGRAVLRDGARTAYTDADVGVGVALGCGHLHTGHTARHGFAHRGYRHLGQRFAVDGRYRAHYVAAFHGGIAYHHHVVQLVRAFREGHFVVGLRGLERHIAVVIADEAHPELLGRGRDFDPELAVQVGAYTERRPFHHDRCGQHGPHGILDGAGDGPALGRSAPCRQRNERQNERQA